MIRSDDALVQGCQQGNRKDFNELVYRYKNDLYQYILALTRDEGAAGDIFQEVFLSFYRNIATYQPQGKLKSYLFTSARNRVLNYFRDQDKAVSLDADPEENAPLQEQIASDEPTVLEKLEHAERLEQIRQAALALPPKQREVIYLKRSMTFQEIADTLQRPLGSVLADYHRGIRKMQERLKEENI